MGAERNAQKRAAKVKDAEPVSSDGAKGNGQLLGTAKDMFMGCCLAKVGPQLPPLLTNGASAKKPDVPDDTAKAPKKISVSIVKATHLKAMNFAGNDPWCECKVGKRVGCKTAVVKGSLEPEWNETHEVEWHEGEDLHFTIYDEGMIASKTEGDVTLPSEKFFPNGFDGEVKIEGLEDGGLHIRVAVLDDAGGSNQLFGSLKGWLAWHNSLGLAQPSTGEDAWTAWMAMKGLEVDWGPRKSRRGNPSLDRVMVNFTNYFSQYLHILLLAMLLRAFLLRSFFSFLPWLFVLQIASLLVPLEMVPQVKTSHRVAGTMAVHGLLWLFFLWEALWRTYFFEKILIVGFFVLHAHSVRQADA